MRRWLLGTLILWSGFSSSVALSSTDTDMPKKAECQACAVRGAGHGEEDVVAWREYEGARYYFCSKDCAAAFDGFPAAYVPHPLPRPAPEAVVSTLEGAKLRLADFEGKVMLVDFWATWCAPCIEAMPHLTKLHDELAGAGFTVLGISIDEDAKKVVPDFVAKKKPSYPIALDAAETPAWQAFQVAAIPAMFLIDGKGNIVAEWKGKIDISVVRKAVERLLDAAPPPK